MPKLQRLRTHAYHAQQGRCCYCGVPMWIQSPEELCALGLRLRTAKPLRCTAEHLVAKRDGGRDVAENIAAACWLCNTRRHQRKSAPAPEAYRAFVKRRVAQGKWHASPVRAAVGRAIPKL